MERMKHTGDYELDTINMLEQECADLEEENKKLKSDLDKYKKYYDRDKEELMESCYSLAKENDKLKSDLEECECSMHFENDEVGYRKRECKKLKEELETATKCSSQEEGKLRNLEKENKELQRENDKLKIHIEAKDKAYMDLLADYNYLKARIKKTERAFIKYKEKLEKLEVDLDMVVMNR